MWTVLIVKAREYAMLDEYGEIAIVESLLLQARVLGLACTQGARRASRNYTAT